MSPPVHTLDTEKQTDAPKHRSFGNRVFDIAWMLQAFAVWGLSLAIAREATKGTTPAFNWLRSATKSIESGVTRFMEKPSQNSVVKKIWGNTTAKEWGYGESLYSVTTMGGVLLLPLIKWMEQNRESISARIDRMFHKTPKSPDEVKEEPKQTWYSILIGRLGVIALAQSIFLAVGPRRMVGASNWVGDKVAHAYQSLRPNADKAKVSSWANLMAFDFILTAGCTAFHYAYSRFVARKKAKELTAPAEVANTAAPVERTEREEPIATYTRENRNRPHESYRERRNEEKQASHDASLAVA